MTPASGTSNPIRPAPPGGTTTSADPGPPAAFTSLGDANVRNLLAALEEARRKVCPYTTQHDLGGPQTCDCKHGIFDDVPALGSRDLLDYERTGCPELRRMIAVLRAAVEDPTP